MPSSSLNLSSLASRLGRLVLRLGFWLIAAVAIMSLLVVSLGLLMLGLLRALITGKRPQPMMKFNFQNFTASQGTRFWPRDNAETSAEAAPATRDPLAGQRSARQRLGAGRDAVVDVEAKEIPDQPRA